jgi:hypothetical protein
MKKPNNNCCLAFSFVFWTIDSRNYYVFTVKAWPNNRNARPQG